MQSDLCMTVLVDYARSDDNVCEITCVPDESFERDDSQDVDFKQSFCNNMQARIFCVQKNEDKSDVSAECWVRT